MKTFEEIIKQKSVLLNEWEGKEKADVLSDFEEKETDVNILFASYDGDLCEGNAWVLIEEGGKLFEVNGSHCSCHGLEDQWEPEEVALNVLEHRLLNGTFGEPDFKEELCDFLGVEFKLNH
ncbi:MULTISPECIES: hypothetical protein [Bacillus subtilis group]|uniref:hypothetical protein n=1 Tax=Bacillus TaxID=1386 RepID=UPI00020597BF|nr:MULTISPECIES: hypothetical protein [Bacillus subtilis group]AEB23485.1 hypothetical protein BAMTA208_06550 [Bacillus amyloliquefaciens TA208]AEK88482.1 hypothetical protein BAXH7_01344 [Bacillus amyloliquefaciens XH7]AIW34064.1 hypothetical protein KS08_10595 [Bacillus subtilis]KYC94867.1 hypothetical protein B425_1777 [Bacillus amyloliquefaciens]MBG8575229.1 hypothetical protein [Bacillus subtilis]